MEKIYTIPVNETFEESDGCPFCRLYGKLEENELDIILGASMMEPDIRIQTNKKGFCHHHYDMMFTMKNRLGMALMMESHIDELIKCMNKGSLFQDKLKTTSAYLGEATNSCYVCDRIENNFTKMMECAMILFDTEEEFRNKFRAQPYFCIKHFGMMMNVANTFIGKKNKPMFLEEALKIENKYLEELKGDISHFCRKFDYRYDDEPWGNSKDAVERAIKSIYH